MKNGIIVDTRYFEGVDLDKPSVTPPIIAKMQANARAMAQSQAHKPSIFDNDVWLLIQQKSDNPNEVAKINGVLRLMLA